MTRRSELQPSLSRRLTAEFVGTALLLAAVVGSGIMGERLASGNVGLALLCNTLATGAALVALILTFGPISGAHFNPVVSFADASQGGISVSEATAYRSLRWRARSLVSASPTSCSLNPFMRGPSTPGRVSRRYSASSSPRSACSRSFGDARDAARLPCRLRSRRTSRQRTGLRHRHRLRIRR